ncbi:acyl carrier protein [Nocardioides daedukensis]|uniref:Acyl carrier protein n=1 Tax=Nocardioides daedukensis TaxID=634462 RepID=A0A7Y9S483_9ACTN|nr:acyl carrier protein [Nocardioides daedukensis]NYG59733.1 acyl carrier protein [Nocardioides daedukensis]
MAIAAADVEKVVREFVARVKDDAPEFGNDTPLYADGVGLDSLETAELSAVLEDEFDTDPFAGDELPQTLGEILAFYAGVPSGARA